LVKCGLPRAIFLEKTLKMNTPIEAIVTACTTKREQCETHCQNRSKGKIKQKGAGPGETKCQVEQDHVRTLNLCWRAEPKHLGHTAPAEKKSTRGRGWSRCVGCGLASDGKTVPLRGFKGDLQSVYSCGAMGLTKTLV